MEPRSLKHLALGEAIRTRREEVGLSQERLGLESGIDRSYVGGVERGERNISFANLLRIARALDVNPSQFLLVAERSKRWR
jgi:transcriptional regulator with XRE-family HTH domain